MIAIVRQGLVYRTLFVSCPKKSKRKLIEQNGLFMSFLTLVDF